jgi:hypothetical protein
MVDYRVELRVDDAWQDITSDVRDSDALDANRGRRDWASVTDPATLKLKLNNGPSKVSQGQMGRYSPRNPRSDLFDKIGRNTPIRVVRADNGDVRFSGEVSEWPMRWDLSGNDVWVKAKASGILRRLGKNSSPLDSALSRFITDSDPLAYWPLTDGPESGQQARPFHAGGNFRFLLRDPTAPTGLIYTRPDWQAAEPAPWLEPILRPNGVRGIGRGTVPGGSTTSWVADFVRFEVGGQDSFNVVTQSGQTRDTWFIGEDPTVDPREIFVSLLSEELDDGTSSIAVLGTATPGVDLFDDNPHHMRLEVTADGASNLDWVLYLDGEILLNGSRAVSSKPVRQLQYEWWVQDDGVSGFIGLGHFTVWPQSSAPAVADMASATRGFEGEAAGRRVERLCVEEGIDLVTVGDLDETQLMGPQRIEPFLTLLRQAEAVDGGVLGEDLSTNALSYRTIASHYNNAPSLILDYTHGIIGEPFEPVDDDQLLANDVTASRTEGGQANAVRESGALSVQAPPDGVGRYDKSVTLNVATDSQLPSQAGWRLHLGTIDEARFPTLALNLRNPRVEAFADDVLDVDLGDIIRIDNPPEWLPPGPYKLFVEAVAETKTATTHEIEFTCTPGRAWDVLELGDDELGRLDTGGSTLDAAIDADDTVFDVVTQSGSKRWIDSAAFSAQFPFDVKVGGEVMRVTAISGTGQTQEFTVTRSINGITKSHASGASLLLALPTVLAL